MLESVAEDASNKTSAVKWTNSSQLIVTMDSSSFSVRWSLLSVCLCVSVDMNADWHWWCVCVSSCCAMLGWVVHLCRGWTGRWGQLQWLTSEWAYNLTTSFQPSLLHVHCVDTGVPVEETIVSTCSVEFTMTRKMCCGCAELSLLLRFSFRKKSISNVDAKVTVALDSHAACTLYT